MIEAALGEHRILSEVRIEGDAYDVAWELASACADFQEPTFQGLSSMCALLAAIRADGLASGPDRDEFADLFQRLDCETPKVDWSHPPYPGILALDHWQAPVFFGRWTETQELLRRLAIDQGSRFLIATGASGSGKSSLVRAGLWATLKAGGAPQIRGSADWRITAMLPSKPNNNPFEALTWSLNGLPIPGFGDPCREAKRLAADPDTFGDLLARVLSGRPAHAEWLLILDQLEECFTSVPPDLSDRFLDDLLIAAAEQPRFRVVASVRSDFLDRCVDHARLSGVLNDNGQYGVRVPARLAMERMITGPLQNLTLEHPVTIDADLVERMVEDAGGTPGGLALLAFALKDLYDHCGGKGRMGLGDYLGEQIGGLKGVIAERAKTAVARAGVETEAVLPRVFSRLLTVQPDGNPTRRREDLDYWDGDADARALIDALADQETRLLVLSEKPAPAAVPADAAPAGYGRVLEVAHETLFSAWPDLKNWIDKRREALIRRPQVERDAALWDSEGRPDRRVYKPDIVTETRGLLEDAKLWDDMAQDSRVAHFLVRDDVDGLRVSRLLRQCLGMVPQQVRRPGRYGHGGSGHACVARWLLARLSGPRACLRPQQRRRRPQPRERFSSDQSSLTPMVLLWF